MLRAFDSELIFCFPTVAFNYVSMHSFPLLFSCLSEVKREVIASEDMDNVIVLKVLV